MKKVHYVTIRLDADMHDLIAEIAQKFEVSKGYIIRKLIKKHLKSNKNDEKNRN